MKTAHAADSTRVSRSAVINRYHYSNNSCYNIMRKPAVRDSKIFCHLVMCAF